MILGRSVEQARIDGLLADARGGTGGALVIRGEAGIGKTALLDHAAVAGADLRVLRGVGIESEIEVPFAGLHLLLHPYLEHVDALPRPQGKALRAAFGLVDADTVERFLIGAATLSLLSELAGDGPLVCLIDDTQWFDRASADALLFAARRLRQEPVAMLFAVRDGTGHFPAEGIDTVVLPTLDRDSAIAMLNERARGLAGPTRARILTEARGNPLAIIEFTAALTDRRHGDDHGWSLPVEPLPVATQVQDAFRARIGELPEPAQRLLLLAAADDTADLTVLLRAAERLGLTAADLEPAEHAHLLTLSADTVAFRHPLIRAAAHQGAPRGWRLAAHLALADTLTGDQYADRRAWHLAAAATGPDENAADALEQAALRAGQRGGSAAVAIALERAAQLTTDPDRRARRQVGAARAAYDISRLDRAAGLAAAAADVSADESLLAEAAWIRAQVAYERDNPATAAALMLDGTAPIVGSHPEQAVSILTDAIGCAKDACAHHLVHRAAQLLAKVSLPPGSALRPVVEGMIGLDDLFNGATRSAVAGMRKLVAAAQDGQVRGLVERVLAGYLALVIADDQAATEVLDALAADVRRQGALGWLPYALEPLAIAQLLRGRFRDAGTTVAEALAVSTDLGQETQALIMNAIPAWLAAVADDADTCRSHAEVILRNEARHPTNAALATWALGLLDLGRGRFDTAADTLDAVCAGPARQDFLIRAVPDHVEAAVRSGQATRAARHLPALDDWADHTGQPHAAALARRCHALLAAGPDAGTHYDAALRLHQETDRPYDHARTALLYGAWLRRQRRRTDARTHLTDALTGFERLGAHGWAARARTELAALGSRPVARSHDRDPAARLTPQELQVVRLAAGGLSNRDIAAQLFLSPRTVGHHLYRAYPKLGITKRTELARFTL
ncbi:DNA-binding CsgD family transcriptional regulator [Saccharothrix tamanrassetensis]|uniref:DNA-binding CsgD family transcriptional regulator n=1 Tax=Saccharothrix tamanrassetensis TaxID=1051531 RepID=A0A841CK01_9PSEU|nr:helix-turn-helix transcriptional regulator [Saccharothrix tamanrassetensis]MBB5956325.1 DNA-binding CsgD family transcriptional regulator [Saccharothrix tamanrassetensis]